MIFRQSFPVAFRRIVVLLILMGSSACGGGSSTSTVPTSSGAESGSVALSWTPPDFNTDGSALADLSGYRIAYGREAGNFSESIWITDPTTTAYVIDYLSAGTWYFAIVALNSEGMESDMSNVLSKTIS